MKKISFNKPTDQFFLPLKNFFIFNKKRKLLKDDLSKYLQELKEAQAKLVQAEKLSIIGEKVASIVHDLSNPLTVLIGNVDILCNQTSKKDKQDYETTKQALDKIRKAVEKLKASVVHIKNFSRASNQKLIETNLNEVINNAFQMVETELKNESINVVKELGPSLPSILGDPNELEQVIINLINNAKDSMTLLRKEHPEHRPELKILSRATSNGAEIVIKDNGKGIPKDLQDKLFKPFFTTKEYGKGTGLGLSISQKIIDRHGAKILVDSIPGSSTSFVLSFNKKDIEKITV